MRPPSRLSNRRSRWRAPRHSRRRQGPDEAGDERLGDAPVGVERGVEDGDLDAHDASAVDRQSKDRLQLGPAQSAGQSVVDGRHQGVVDGVAVEVHPHPGELRSVEVGEGIPGGALGSALPDRRQVDDGDGGVLDALAAGLLGLVGVTPSEHRDVFVSDQRSATLEVGQQARTPARGERQVHRGGLTAGIGFRLVEVGVPVDEQQPVAAASAEGQQVAEQDRAVAAEHDRDVAPVEHLTGRRGEQMRVVAKPRRVEHAGVGVTRPVVGQRTHASATTGPEPVGEAGRQQRLRKPLDAAGEEPERRRRLDDHIAGDAPSSLCAVVGIVGHQGRAPARRR